MSFKNVFSKLSLAFVALLLSASLAFAGGLKSTGESDCFADCFKHESPALVHTVSDVVASAELDLNSSSTEAKHRAKLKQIELDSLASAVGDGTGFDGWEYWQFYSGNSDEPIAAKSAIGLLSYKVTSHKITDNKVTNSHELPS